MTNPALSVQSTKDIGRLYGKPGHTYDKKLSTKAAKEGLLEDNLFPSITNVVGVVNPELAGYWQFMGRKGLQKGLSPYDSLKEADRWLVATGERGTRVHAFIEEYIDAGFVKTGGTGYKNLGTYADCEYWNSEMGDLDYIEGFFRFVEDYNPQFLTQETTVYGRTLNGLGYAGTTDFIAYIGDKVIIGDWKTTSKLKSSVALQLSAIQRAEQMAVGDKLETLPAGEECWGIQLRKDGTYAVGVVDNIDRSFQLFSAAAELWALKVGVEELLEIKEGNN